MIRVQRCLMAVVGMLAVTFGLGSIAAAADVPSSAAASSTTRAPANEYCPVMAKTKAEADLWLDYEGQRIYFCHEVCKTRFGRAPGKYLANLPMAMQQAIREHQEAAATAEPPTDAATHPASGPVPSKVEVVTPEADHHQGTSALRRVGQFLGRFHPVAVHLPIGLLLAAALAEILFMWAHTEWLAGAARFCVLLGAAGAVGAASLGWLNAMSANYDGDLAQVLEYHRWLGTGTAALAVVAAVLGEVQRRRPVLVLRIGYRVALLLAGVSVGITGHFGGMLVYGVDYFKWR